MTVFTKAQLKTLYTLKPEPVLIVNTYIKGYLPLPLTHNNMPVAYVRGCQK